MPQKHRAKRVVLNSENRNQRSPQTETSGSGNGGGRGKYVMRLTNPEPPKVPAWYVDTACTALLIGGCIAIAGDVYMSWRGFDELGLSLVPSVVLTSIVAITQVGSATVQALGGSPRKGIGGNDEADFVWGLILPGAYFLDFVSNFYGFGGVPHILRILIQPINSIGMILTHAMLALLLCFGDEILFRIRHQLSPSAEANRLRARGRRIELDANYRALNKYRQRAMDRADDIGMNAPIDLEWMDD